MCEKRYITLEMEITEFDIEDIIVTSNTDATGQDGNEDDLDDDGETL